MPLNYDDGQARRTWRDATGEPSSTTVFMLDLAAAVPDQLAWIAAADAVFDACEAFQYAGTNKVTDTYSSFDKGLNPGAPSSDNRAQRELKLAVVYADTAGNTQEMTIPMVDPDQLTLIPGAGDFVDVTQPEFTALLTALQEVNIQSKYGNAISAINSARIIGVSN